MSPKCPPNVSLLSPCCPLQKAFGDDSITIGKGTKNLNIARNEAIERNLGCFFIIKIKEGEVCQ